MKEEIKNNDVSKQGLQFAGLTPIQPLPSLKDVSEMLKEKEKEKEKPKEEQMTEQEKEMLEKLDKIRRSLNNIKAYVIDTKDKHDSPIIKLQKIITGIKGHCVGVDIKITEFDSGRAESSLYITGDEERGIIAEALTEILKRRRDKWVEDAAAALETLKNL